MRAFDSKPAKKRPEKEERSKEERPVEKGLEIKFRERRKNSVRREPCAAQKRIGAATAPKSIVAAK